MAHSAFWGRLPRALIFNKVNLSLFGRENGIKLGSGGAERALRVSPATRRPQPPTTVIGRRRCLPLDEMLAPKKASFGATARIFFARGKTAPLRP